MKIKLITASIILAVSGNASAAIVSSIDTNGGGGGLSEAVFSIWDPSTNQSYSLDLGTTWQTFRDNLNNADFAVSYTINTAAGSVYNQAIGASDTANLAWNVSVANGQNSDFSNFTDFGVISTSNRGNNINTNALNQAIVVHDQYATSLGGSLPVTNKDTTLNDEYFGTLTNGGYAGSERIWGTSWQTNGSTDNSAAFGTDLDFYYWQTGGFSTDPNLFKAAGVWSFDGSTLGYASPVPVPAAVWLFASGLLGLVGVSRRKKMQA